MQSGEHGLKGYMLRNGEDESAVDSSSLPDDAVATWDSAVKHGVGALETLKHEFAWPKFAQTLGRLKDMNPEQWEQFQAIVENPRVQSGIFAKDGEDGLYSLADVTRLIELSQRASQMEGMSQNQRLDLLFKDLTNVLKK